MIIVSRKDHPELISQLQTRFAGSKQVFCEWGPDCPTWGDPSGVDARRKSSCGDNHC